MTTPQVLSRVRDVPSRIVPALLLFGGMLGLPALIAALGSVFFAVGLEAAGGVSILLALLAFLGGAVAAWVMIFQGRTRLKRAEQALYAGDFETATREGRFVVRTVFRSDYQMGALFTLALAAERIGAFAEAGALFVRAFDMLPTMAAQRPGRRARALLASHAALDLAASNDLARANAMLARAWTALGATGQPGAFEAILDDSGMGAIGINTMLVELENRREPRPLAVLASALVAFKSGQAHQALSILGGEQATMIHGLAVHERSLAERIHAESIRRTTEAGPHRSAGVTPPVGDDAGSGWAELVVPPANG